MYLLVTCLDIDVYCMTNIDLQVLLLNLKPHPIYFAFCDANCYGQLLVISLDSYFQNPQVIMSRYINPSRTIHITCIEQHITHTAELNLTLISIVNKHERKFPDCCKLQRNGLFTQQFLSLIGHCLLCISLHVPSILTTCYRDSARQTM